MPGAMAKIYDSPLGRRRRRSHRRFCRHEEPWYRALGGTCWVGGRELDVDDPLGTGFLGQDQDNILKYEWCNKKLSSCILKPDYTLYFEDKEDKEVATFIVEVKAPSRNKNSNDFIKLGFTLKSMLDSLIKRGMRSPRVLGLLVDGKLGNQESYILY